MPLPTYYAAGTASVANGDTTVTFSGAMLGTEIMPNIMAGDLFLDPAQPEIPPQRIASIDYGAGTAELSADWPGATMSDDPYEVRYIGIIERSTAQNRRYLEMLGQLQALGIQPNAFGEFADREVYDDERKGFIFLSLSSPWTLYAKLSGDSADWSTGQTVEGAQGPQGPSALAGVWRGAYSGATAYAENDVVLYEGSSWIALQGTTGNAPPSLPTTANDYWELTAAAGTDGAPGNDGAPGTDGVGVPAGGSAGQVLAKASGDDHDTEWVEQSGGREVLTGNRTYYVRTDGSDSNDGLANTSGGAFATIQRALDVVSTLDVGIHDVTVAIGSGTYTAGANTPVANVLPWVGSGALLIQGDAGTPSNVVLSGSGGHAVGVTVAALSGKLLLDGLKLQTTGSGNCISTTVPCVVEHSNIEFGDCGSLHVNASFSSYIRALTDYVISGGAIRHWNASTFGRIDTTSRNITLSGTPAFTHFAGVTFGYLVVQGNTFVGAATGRRYAATANGIISTSGGGASYLPGDTDGVVSTGGQYI